MQRSQKISPLEGIRHSLAHLLAAAVIKKFPKAKLGIGPTIENGFYYDFLLPKSLTPDDLKELETTMKSLAKAKLEFSGKKVTPGEAKKSLTVYKTYDKKTGEVYFLDLCRGGHVKNTSEINADSFKLNKIAGAYWRGDEKNEQLQRIYGLAFETEKELKDYAEMLAKAETSDHRNLADKLQLFMVDENIGRGLPLWLPNAYTTRKVLEDYMYELERRAGYKQVLTPHLAKEDLYKTSGDLAHYKDDMYA